MKVSRWASMTWLLVVTAFLLTSCLGGGTTMNRFVPAKTQLIGDVRSGLASVTKVAVFPITTSAAKAQFSIDMLSSIFYDQVNLSKGFERVVVVDPDLSSKVLKKAKEDLKAQNIDADAKLTDVRTLTTVGQLLGVDAVVLATIHQVEELKLEKAKITLAAIDVAVLDARKGAYKDPTEVTPVKYLWKVDAKNENYDTLITTRQHEQYVAIDLIGKLVRTMVDDLKSAAAQEKSEFNRKIAEMKEAANKLYRAKKYEEAIAGYEKVLEIAAKDQDSLAMIERIQKEVKEQLQKQKAKEEAEKAKAEKAKAAAEKAKADAEKAKAAAEKAKADAEKAKAEKGKPAPEAPKAEATPEAEEAPKAEATPAAPSGAPADAPKTEAGTPAPAATPAPK